LRKALIEVAAAVVVVVAEEDVAAQAMSKMETTKKNAQEPKEVTDPEVVAEVALALKAKKAKDVEEMAKDVEEMAKDVEDKEEAAIETPMLSAEKATLKSNALKREENARDSKEKLAKVLILMTAKMELAVEREVKTDKVVAADNGALLRTTLSKKKVPNLKKRSKAKPERSLRLKK